ncbi:25974_t:CDS:2, partial [Gigaspora rosea]
VVPPPKAQIVGIVLWSWYSNAGSWPLVMWSLSSSNGHGALVGHFSFACSHYPFGTVLLVPFIFLVRDKLSVMSCSQVLPILYYLFLKAYTHCWGERHAHNMACLSGVGYVSSS